MLICYPRRALLALTLTLATGAAIAYQSSTASAQATTVEQATSQNWAGYIAKSSSGTSFSSVSGSWTQPAASSSSSSASGYSAFWVGLGGSSGDSESLEQVGTASDWVDGRAEYYAWYELLPAGQVKLDLAINAGDHIAASVNVSGSTVTIRLVDETSGAAVTKTESMSSPDTSSAEWIAEAPAAQTSSGGYETLPLANFGSVKFGNASATGGGHTRSISDSSWTVQQVSLGSAASTSSLSDDGSSFSVWFESSSTAGASQPLDPQPGPGHGDDSGGYGYDGGPGYDYGGGYGYGYGGGPGYGYAF
jgi:Peptidase A4 family